jgi:chromosome segregation and condensation protein ScpB
MTTNNTEPISLSALVESILFVAIDPVPVPVLASVLEVDSAQVEDALQALKEDSRSCARETG